MPLFRVLLVGEHFPGSIVGQSKAIGFYTTRFVEASTPAAAELLALAVLRSEPSLMAGAEHQTANATVKIKELNEVHPSTEQKPNAGFTFFPMET